MLFGVIEIKLQALKSFKKLGKPLRKHRISEGKGRCGIALNFPVLRMEELTASLFHLCQLYWVELHEGGRLKAVFIVWNRAEHIRNSTDTGCGVCV